MNDIKIFKRQEFGAVRVVEKDGEPWFVASDIARALGYERPNDAVNTHCKKVNKFRYGDMPHGAQPYNIIPESDVYRLVMRSNLPDAERFQDWVVEEVLPSIRSGTPERRPCRPYGRGKKMEDREGHTVAYGRLRPVERHVLPGGEKAF